jgi:hypothetical protein
MKTALFLRTFPFLAALAAAAPAPVEVVFASKTAADGASVPASVLAIRTLGYHAPGQGAALYTRAGAEPPVYAVRGGRSPQPRPPSHYIAAKNESSGAPLYFLLSEETPDVLQFGAIADALADGSSSRNPGQPAADATAAFNDALAYGKGALVPAGRYWIAGTIRVLVDGSVLQGNGPGGAGQGGAELVFGPGKDDCIVLGDGKNQLRWGKVTRLMLNPKLRAGGNAIFANFNYQLTLSELRINAPHNGILLFRGLGFSLRDIVMSAIRAGDGTPDGPREIGYGIKLAGAPVLYDKDTGAAVKRNAQVLYLENISFGSAKHETDPANWTVGLWCAGSAASVNGATLKNQNVRHGVYIAPDKTIDASNPFVVPPGYRLVPAAKTVNGRTHRHGSAAYPAKPGDVVNEQRHFQDLTLFYLGGDYLGGEYIYNENGSGVAIHNPHFMRSYQGNAVFMGANARDMSLYGGQIIGAFRHGLDMNGERWLVSGVQIYRHSLDDKNRRAHAGKFSAIHVGATSVGGDIANCKIGNEPPGTTGRGGDTVRFGVEIEKGARSTWIHGNRFNGCIEAGIANRAGAETKAADNLPPPGEAPAGR